MVRNYRDLVVWQKAMDLVEAVYAAGKTIPKTEEYGLKGQLQRAAVSVPANIAEGSGRERTKELFQFLSLAKGSLMEMETHLLIAQRVKYLPSETVDALLSRSSEVGRLLNGLLNSVRKKLTASRPAPSTD